MSTQAICNNQGAISILLNGVCTVVLVLTTILIHQLKKTKEQLHESQLSMGNLKSQIHSNKFDEHKFKTLLMKAQCFYTPTKVTVIGNSNNSTHLNISIQRSFGMGSHALNNLPVNLIDIPIKIQFEKPSESNPPPYINRETESDNESETGETESELGINSPKIKGKQSSENNKLKHDKEESHHGNQNNFNYLDDHFNFHNKSISKKMESRLVKEFKKKIRLTNESSLRMTDDSINWSTTVENIIPGFGLSGSKSCSHDTPKCCFAQIGNCHKDTVNILKLAYKGQYDFTTRLEEVLDETKIRDAINLLIDCFDWNCCPCTNASADEFTQKFFCDHLHHDWESHYLPVTTTLDIFNQPPSKEILKFGPLKAKL